MAKLTTDEKRTILSLLQLIMEADHIIHPNEMQMMEDIFAEYNMPAAEIDLMDNPDVTELKKKLNEMNQDKKDYAFSLFKKMTESDGVVVPEETELIQFLNN